MEQEENNIQPGRVTLIIKLLNSKCLPLPLYLPQAIQHPERVHYEENVNHSFNKVLWKELMESKL
jgi:hypothetical protein